MNQIVDYATTAMRASLREVCSALDPATPLTQRPPAYTYVPAGHARALEFEVTAVKGILGSGKSFWWTQLFEPERRSFLKTLYPDLRFDDNIRVVRGFGSGVPLTEAPDAKTLNQLLLAFADKSEFYPRMIWRAVLAHGLQFDGEFATLSNWPQRVAWVHANNDNFEQQLKAADERLVASGQRHLVLFDALESMSDDRGTIHTLVGALLQLARDVRFTRNIRFKIFIRPDMASAPAITTFPNAARALAYQLDLVWGRADLYALLFQCLANTDQGGPHFRELCSDSANLKWQSFDGCWVLPVPLRSDEALQEAVFHALAGKVMGVGPRQGRPYGWLYNHLQDGLQEVSPRAFFAALKTASEESPETCPLVLDYNAIKTGVQHAASVRVREISESYPWVAQVMAPLHGQLSLPVERKEINAIWRAEGTLAQLENAPQPGNEPARLPPQHLEDGRDGVLQDLANLGVMQFTYDGRIQMPDIYRIPFGLGRKGGLQALP